MKFHNCLFEIQRCFTTYIPPDLKDEKLPLMMLSQCYARDKLVMMLMKDIDSPLNGAARQFGFARIAISTPNGKMYSYGPLLKYQLQIKPI